MIRVLVYIALIALIALGASWLAANPGTLSFDWMGYRVDTSIFLAVAVILGLALAISLLWALIRSILRLPRALSLAAHMRRRNKGYEALSRGMIAIGAGDVRSARRDAVEAARLLKHEPLTLLLKAQAAQLAGDRATAEALFSEMARRQDTKVLGLRGLYVEARRRGDAATAFRHAEEAQKLAPVAWAGQAMLEHSAAGGDWAAALATVERLAAAGQIEKPKAARERAVLKTAMALERAEREPDAALALARDALAEAPGLVPAAALAARLYGRRGDLKKGARIVEDVWREATHPDLADVYVDLRPGDSSLDRLERARRLARLAPKNPDSLIAVAQAAIDAKEFAAARAALEPLLNDPDKRPSVRVAMTMAELEQASGGPSGKVREWYSRAARAPRDPAWIADGVISDVWAPVSPVTGALDAFVWRTPDERLASPVDDPLDLFDEEPAAPAPALAAPAPVVVPAEPAEVEAPPKAEAPKSEPPKAEPAKAAAPAPKKPEPEPVAFALTRAPDDPGPDAR
jgi:HemY protein